MYGSCTSTRALALGAPPGKLDTVPDSQLVIDDSKTVLDDGPLASNFSSDVPVIEPLGDESDDVVFPFSWASLPVRITSEHSLFL